MQNPKSYKNSKKNKGSKERGQSKNRDMREFSGVLSLSRRGTGYVDVGLEEDVEIPRESLKCSLNGDEVKIILLPRIKGQRQRGEVQEIIKVGKREFVGTIKKTGTALLVEPDSKKMYIDIRIAPTKNQKLQEGDKVLAKITNWQNPRENPEGIVVNKIGRTGVHETEMQAILLDRGIDWNFSEKILNEAEKTRQQAEEEISSYDPKKSERSDFRDRVTFTIDPDTAKDFDDAISVKKIDNDWFEIGIHIADVAYYVREDGILDAEARERGFSVYLVDRTVPMLPEALSNDIASLVPKEDRFTFSAVFEINSNAELRKSWFGRTIIHSDKRFSYEDAQAILDKGVGEHFSELSIARRISRGLRKKKKEAGAIEFNQDEIKFELDQNGKPINIYKKENIETHSLIEELMLLANREVAKKIEKESKGKYPFIYRVHGAPDPDKMASLGIFMRACGYDFETKGPVTSKDIQKMLDRVSGTDIESLIEASTLRSMAKAVYSVKNIGHFGLAFTHYTHFTSPIRRYPDLIVHRLLWKFLKNQPLEKSAMSYYTKIAKEASAKEIEVTDAERSSIKYKQVEYMATQIGKEFDARIVGVVEYGVFVEEFTTLSDGLVPVSSLADDYYVYDRENFELRGTKKKRRFRLGDKIRVRVTDVNLSERTISFEVVKN